MFISINLFTKLSGPRKVRRRRAFTAGTTADLQRFGGVVSQSRASFRWAWRRLWPWRDGMAR